MDRGDASQREDGWGDGDERNSSSDGEIVFNKLLEGDKGGMNI